MIDMTGAVPTLYEAHQAAGHDDCRHSPDGVSIIVECETCMLAWVMPPAHRPNDNPHTMYKWMWALKAREAASA